jgi:hypothetical protein
MGWQFRSTVLWLQRGQVQETPPRQPGLAAVAALTGPVSVERQGAAAGASKGGQFNDEPPF